MFALYVMYPLWHSSETRNVTKKMHKFCDPQAREKKQQQKQQKENKGTDEKQMKI